MTYPDCHPLGLQNVTLKMKSYTYRDTQKALKGNTNPLSEGVDAT